MHYREIHSSLKTSSVSEIGRPEYVVVYYQLSLEFLHRKVCVWSGGGGGGCVDWTYLVDVPLFFYKGVNFCDFLFALLHTNPFLKRSLLQKERICSLGANSFLLEKTPFQKGGITIFTVVSPEKYPVLLINPCPAE